MIRDNQVKLLDRSRVKKEKIFGTMVSEHMRNDHDENVYNDNEFYQALLKDFLATNESGPVNDANAEDD